MIFFVIISIYDIKLRELNEVLLNYKKTKDEKIENEFLKMYNSIKPVGIDIYIQYLLLKKDKNRIKEEMNNTFKNLKFEKEIKDTIRYFYIYNGVFNSIIILRDDDDFYKNLQEFIKLIKEKPITISKGRAKEPIENKYMINIINTLSRYGNIDSLVKYEEFDIYLRGDLLKEVKEKRNENKRIKNLLMSLKNSNQDSALMYTKSDYEKALVYAYFGYLDKVEGIIKMEYKNKNLLALFIILKSGEKNSVKCISSRILGLDRCLPTDDLSMLFYSLIFDTTLKWKDKDLESYLIYLEIEEGKIPEDTLLKKYPESSPSFIIRNRRK